MIERIKELEGKLNSAVTDIDEMMKIAQSIDIPSDYDKGFMAALKRCRDILKYE